MLAVDRRRRRAGLRRTRAGESAPGTDEERSYAGRTTTSRARRAGGRDRDRRRCPRARHRAGLQGRRRRLGGRVAGRQPGVRRSHRCAPRSDGSRPVYRRADRGPAGAARGPGRCTEAAPRPEAAARRPFSRAGRRRAQRDARTASASSFAATIDTRPRRPGVAAARRPAGRSWLALAVPRLGTLLGRTLDELSNSGRPGVRLDSSGRFASSPASTSGRRVRLARRRGRFVRGDRRPRIRRRADRADR